MAELIYYIKDYSIDIFKYKLSLLYLFNVLDYIFTILLIRTGLFIEANPFMINIINNPSQSILLKICLPAILLVYIFIRMQKAKKHQLIISNTIINGALLGYGMLNLLHLLWFGLLILKT